MGDKLSLIMDKATPSDTLTTSSKSKKGKQSMDMVNFFKLFKRKVSVTTIKHHANAKKSLHSELEQAGFMVCDNSDYCDEYNKGKGMSLIEPISCITSTHSQHGNDEYIQITESNNYVSVCVASVSNENNDRKEKVLSIVTKHAAMFEKKLIPTFDL